MAGDPFRGDLNRTGAMAGDPFAPISFEPPTGGYTVRREILPDSKQPRARPNEIARPEKLPQVFQDSHPWPLKWGGPEVTKGRYFSSATFNTGGMALAENAGIALARTAAELDYRVRATVDVTEFSELHLLDTAVYRFDLGRFVDGAWEIDSLGEVSISQGLSRAQRLVMRDWSLVGGDVRSSRLRYQNGGQTVEINTEKLVVVSREAFANLEGHLAVLLSGTKTKNERSRSNRAKETRKREKATLREGEDASRGRTAAAKVTRKEVERLRKSTPKTASERQREMRATGVADRGAENRGAENRGVEAQPVAPEERMITRPDPVGTEQALLTKKLESLAQSDGLIQTERGKFTKVGGRLYTGLNFAGNLYLIWQLSEIRSLSGLWGLAKGLAVSVGGQALASKLVESGPIPFIATMLLTMPDDQGPGVHERWAASQFLRATFTEDEIRRGGSALIEEARTLLFHTPVFEIRQRQPYEGDGRGSRDDGRGSRDGVDSTRLTRRYK